MQEKSAVLPILKIFKSKNLWKKYTTPESALKVRRETQSTELTQDEGLRINIFYIGTRRTSASS